ncbi:DNA-binding transcriptional MerR regulator [Hypnocyclicus thermotrophus]|uniref:DNA-binding transcriptional MerR regulator n=1 Tax=Hypnocyclicus thermotrophus TaxID=1627895 RepID=A0AA46DZP2_9FUSO|nr:MerR family transcriptional regulator [Hypnocyclicus thermotrophus]TDT71963.1 DNA-binding transcriptional MerR regulator [Hypnocyclicus thermotrophus]
MKKYSIKEISEMFDIKASTLRYYEEIGILENVERISGKRVYKQENIDRLHAIFCFKRAGMTMDKLQKFFEYEKKEKLHIDDMLNLLILQEKEVKEKLEQLAKDYEHVKKKVRFYSSIKEAIETNKEIPTWEEFIKKYNKK